MDALPRSEYALTLTAAQNQKIPADLLEATGQLVRNQKLAPSAPVWLSEGQVCDFIVDMTPDENRSLLDATRLLLRDAPLDWCLQPTEHRRKKMLVADMESTIIPQEMLDEIAEELGFGAEMSEITARSMRGELNFEESLRTRVQRLKGLDRDQLEHFKNSITLHSGARSLIQTLKAHGVFTALVSGGFTIFTDHVRTLCGFDEAYANTLEFDGNTLNGKLTPPLLGPDAKLSIARELANRQNIGIEEICATGDGANDIPMLKAVGLGVGYHPKPIVLKATPWSVRHGDLTTLLYFMGYRKSEILQA
ncbi:phosphoserine phosphatase SerB [Kiloniella sp. b19]|uniref:phosphoserine phosphatase SerB n=1 Tax=Kiloniella sp. GXU_MW_B19 TaxID=3141326 RepID=UPI0031D53EBC